MARCCLLNRCMLTEFSEDLEALRIKRKLSRQKLLGSKRFVAAIQTFRWWQRVARRRWLNQVAWEAARMHAFPHRTETNYPPWRRFFCGGVAGIALIRGTTRFIPRCDTELLCPECGTSPINVAIWSQFGEKMVRSTPHIDIGCRSCMLSREYHYFDAALVSFFEARFGSTEACRWSELAETTWT